MTVGLHAGILVCAKHRLMLRVTESVLRVTGHLERAAATVISPVCRSQLQPHGLALIDLRKHALSSHRSECGAKT